MEAQSPVGPNWGGKIRGMSRFKLNDRVMKDGEWTVRTVHEIREEPGAETLYRVQLGNDFATRIWAKESELELEPPELPRAVGKGRGSRGKPVGKLPRARKVKAVSGHQTSGRRRLKKDHNPKGKRTSKRGIRK